MDMIRLINGRGERVDIHLPMDAQMAAHLMMLLSKEGFDFAEFQEQEAKT